MVRRMAVSGRRPVGDWNLECRARRRGTLCGDGGRPASAAAASAASEVEKYLAGLATWSADFQQTIDDGHGKVMRSAAGKLYLQRPGKFRWDYAEPSEQLVLADGKQIWFYDKDLAQANVRNMDTTLASTPASLLSGNGLGKRPVRHHGIAEERGIALVSASSRSTAIPIFNWCASDSTRTANWRRCFWRTSSIK